MKAAPQSLAFGPSLLVMLNRDQLLPIFFPAGTYVSTCTCLPTSCPTHSRSRHAPPRHLAEPPPRVTDPHVEKEDALVRAATDTAVAQAARVAPLVGLDVAEALRVLCPLKSVITASLQKPKRLFPMLKSVIAASKPKRLLPMANPLVPFKIIWIRNPLWLNLPVAPGLRRHVWELRLRELLSLLCRLLSRCVKLFC